MAANPVQSPASKEKSTPVLVELTAEINRLVANPEDWLNTPHPELKGHKPVEFLEAGREQPLRDLIGAIKLGLFS